MGVNSRPKTLISYKNTLRTTKSKICEKKLGLKQKGRKRKHQKGRLILRFYQFSTSAGKISLSDLELEITEKLLQKLRNHSLQVLHFLFCYQY